jgi:hypothetical protein
VDGSNADDNAGDLGAMFVAGRRDSTGIGHGSRVVYSYYVLGSYWVLPIVPWPLLCYGIGSIIPLQEARIFS